MMEVVKYNPYRILGVFANSSLKEITANKTKLARYTSVGKNVNFDTDMESLLGAAPRTVENVEKAFSDLSLPQDKLRNAFFWFAKDSSIDEMALSYLNTGNLEKAIELFEKRENWSSLINSSILALIKNDYSKSISQLTKVIHNSDYRNSFVNAICGDTFQIEENDLSKLYIDSLKGLKSLTELYQLFSENSDNVWETDYLKASVIDEPKNHLNDEINKAKMVHDNGVAIYDTAANLCTIAKPLLVSLEDMLGLDSTEYKLLTDKYAKTVLQCCIDSFNALQKEMDNGSADQFKEYAPKIKSLLESIDKSKLSAVVTGRIESNLKTISEIVTNLDAYIISQSHLCYYCGKNKALPSAQYKQEMFLETGRNRTFNKRQVFFKQCEIGIDRCEQCKEIHDKGSGGILAVYALFAIAGIVALSIIANVILGIIVGWLPGLLIGYIVESIVDGNKRKKYHVKVEKDIYEHPLVKRLMKEGWTTTEPTA